MRRRTFALATAAAAAGLSLPACGGTREAERGPNDEIIVTFWHSMRGNNGEQMKAFVDEFNESQNEIIVRESEQGMYDERSEERRVGKEGRHAVSGAHWRGRE